MMFSNKSVLPDSTSPRTIVIEAFVMSIDTCWRAGSALRSGFLVASPLLEGIPLEQTVSIAAVLNPVSALLSLYEEDD